MDKRLYLLLQRTNNNAIVKYPSATESLFYIVILRLVLQESGHPEEFAWALGVSMIFSESLS